jgi:hypothetical protein
MSTLVDKFEQNVVELVAMYKKMFKCEGESLDGDQTEELSEMVLGFANKHQGNMDKEEEAEFSDSIVASIIQDRWG